MVGMFWWFKRGSDYVRYESRETSVGVYELRLLDAEGAECVERFDSERDLNDRQRELERGLIQDGWTGPHGWNL
jgi:hypothetical protein